MKKTVLVVLISFLNLALFAQHTPFVAGELLVQLEANTTPQTVVHRFEIEHGLNAKLQAGRELSGIMRVYLFSFDQNEIGAEEMLYLVKKTKGVSGAQLNHLIDERETIPNDPMFGSQWHHVDPQDNDIDTDLAWDITTGGTTATGDEIVVCVIETGGAKWDQADIIANHWTNGQEIAGNGIDDDDNGYIDDVDGWNISNDTDNIGTGNHGTQVSSMIGAKGDNNTGIVGVNWDVKIMQVHMGNISEANVVEAYTYPLVMRKLYNETNGDRGAFVVATNSSWGIDNGQPSNSPLWCAMYDSLGYYGVLSCGATANNNVNIDVVGDLPTACPSDYMISVTATNASDVRTFSGYGITTVDLGAPGENVYLASNNSYGNTSGTSFATPCVAGAIGLLYSAPCESFMPIVFADPALGAMQVRNAILDGVDPVASLSDEVVTGGRLNVKNSLDLLLADCSSGGCIAPFNVNAVSVFGTLNYSVSWSAIQSNTTFNILYSVQGSGVETLITAIASPEYTIMDLLECTTYEVQVSVMCEGIESEWSTPFEFTTLGCCVNPTYGGYTSTDHSAYLLWEYISSADGYTIQLVGQDGTNMTFEVLGNEYTIENLTPCTEYVAYITTICPNTPLVPFALEFSTTGCDDCAEIDYCTIASNGDYEWIDNVTLEGINNNSTGSTGGYQDFRTISTELLAGGTYTISASPGYQSFTYNEFFKAWIDFNANGTLEDNEVVLNPSTYTTSMVSNTFTVPEDAVLGSTLLRVVMSYAGNGNGELPIPCGTLEYGETEDYCVGIVTEVSAAEIAAETFFSIYPNPGNDQVRIDVHNGQYRIQFTDVTGKLVKDQRAGGATDLNVAELESGVYMIRVIDLTNGSDSVLRWVKY